MNVHRIRSLIWVWLCLLLLVAGCITTGSEDGTPDGSTTETPGDSGGDDGVTPEPGDVTPEPVSQAVPVLPAPVYFIGRSSQQIMALSRDGATTTAITDEPTAIESFDVSAENSLLAYVTANQLIQVNMADGTRTVKADGATLATETDFSGEFPTISAPRIAPDGSTIVFMLNGVQSVGTGDDNTVTTLLPSDPLPNFGDPDFEMPEGPIRFFNAADWSPDGSRLLVKFGYFPEAGGMGLFTLADGTFVDLGASGTGRVTCCEFAWLPDSSGGFVTSEIFVYGTPGLSRVDAASATVTDLFGPSETDSATDAFRTGQALADGSFLTLRAEEADIASFPLPYRISQVAADGSATTVRDDVFFPARDVLWATDGSGVIIANQRYNSAYDDPGSAVWVSTSGTTRLQLPISGSAWRWAGTPQPVPTPDAAAIDALKAQAAADFGVTVGTDVNDIATRQLVAANQAVWAAYSVGAHSFDPVKAHQVGLYRPITDGWELLAQTTLDLAIDGEDFVQPGPDYMGEQSVEQAFINANDIWLTVSGGIGAHGGLFEVLRYHDGALTVELGNTNGSPGAGFVADLNGDGFDEVILDKTNPYIFAYATGVRLIDYEIQRWIPLGFISVALTDLGSTADSTLRDANNRMVELAQADLWKDALEMVRMGLDDQGNTTVGWNKALVTLVGSAREQTSYNSAYPLITQMFYGDYPSATFTTFDGMTLDEIFDPAGPAIDGTAAQGSLDYMVPLIQEFTTRALSAKPDEAGAYFLRGWATYLLDPSSTDAVNDVLRAAEVGPNNFLYPDAAAYFSP